MKITIKTAKKIILTGLLAMALAFSIIGCDDSAGDGECTVNFNLDGGNINGDTSSVQIPVKKGTTVDNLPNPQKANNTFGGWFTGLYGSGNEFRTTTVVTSNMTVFAKWIYSGTDGRTVTFDMDGGNIDGNTASMTVTVQSGGTIAGLPNPQKANNTFGGWFTDRNGGGNAFTASTQVTSNMTVYTKWTPSGNSASPFKGTWKHTFSFTMTYGGNEQVTKTGSYTYTFGDTSFEFLDVCTNKKKTVTREVAPEDGTEYKDWKGTYTHTSNTATIVITEAKWKIDDGEWKPDSGFVGVSFTVTLSNDKIILTDEKGEDIIFTKIN